MTQASQSLSEADRLDLIDQWTWLALWMAEAFKSRGDSLDDLQQEAFLGLTRAARNFRPDRSDKFQQHATVAISQHLCKYRAKHGDHPTSYRTNARLIKLSRARKALASQGEVEPSVERLAGAAGLTVDQAASALSSRWHRLPADPDGFARADDDPGDDSSDQLTTILESIETLDDEDQDLLIRRFGMDGGTPQSFIDIGRAKGIAPNLARWRVGRALGRVREAVRGGS